MLPWVKEWQAAYAAEGLTVISVHYPEFAYERDVDNVRRAVADLGIEFPVAIDNDRVAWAAYEQRYWPTLYLIDRAGHIRYKKIGEGAYAVTAAAIEALLAESAPIEE